MTIAYTDQSSNYMDIIYFATIQYEDPLRHPKCSLIYFMTENSFTCHILVFHKQTFGHQHKLWGCLALQNVNNISIRNFFGKFTKKKVSPASVYLSKNKCYNILSTYPKC